MLSDFYHSKEWNLLRQSVIYERTNADGIVICEHCGKPIVKKYDCIAHHKRYLSQQNYGDADISLNPNNIMLVHHACHNRIHEKGFKSLRKGERQVFLVYGSPLSGKSTYVKKSMLQGDIVLDIDKLWEAISGQPLYAKPNEIKSNVFELRDTILNQIKYRKGRWLNAYVIGGYPFEAERERLIKELGAREVFIESTKEECLRRLKADKHRGDDYKKYIEDWFRKYSGTF